jgi:hypothetical protein
MRKTSPPVVPTLRRHEGDMRKTSPPVEPTLRRHEGDMRKTSSRRPPVGDEVPGGSKSSSRGQQKVLQ